MDVLKTIWMCRSKYSARKQKGCCLRDAKKKGKEIEDQRVASGKGLLWRLSRFTRADHLPEALNGGVGVLLATQMRWATFRMDLLRRQQVC